MAVPGLVLLIGPAGSGKSTFAARHFKPTEVISSDWCRALVSDNPNNQAVTPDAFKLVHLLAELRLKRRRLAVVDATNVGRADRSPLLQIAAERRRPVTAIVFDVPLDLCLERDAARAERRVGAIRIGRQWDALQRNLPLLADEGYAAVHVLRTAEDLDTVRVVRTRAHTPPA